MRHLHLGLGGFMRAHQAWYTEHSPDADEWGIAAFTGRSSRLADALAAQHGLYTLTIRSERDDQTEIVSALSAVHPAADHERLAGYFVDTSLALVTLTVTEAGYHRAADGHLDRTDPRVAADVAALQAGSVVARTIPGRLVAGFAVRRAAGANPLAVVPCDNLPGNGAAVRQVITDLCGWVDPSLAVWVRDTVEFVDTVVDRITPAMTPDDIASVRTRTGWEDVAPVVTEPFTEWILAGTFPTGRPAWAATVTEDVTPYENRKLWLLNGAHSLLAYCGSVRGHETVADAIADADCRGWVREWWADAAPHIGLPGPDLDTYTYALLRRFGNARIRHRLEQIAMDGSQKLPLRVVPVLRAERTAGRMPGGAVRILAGWLCHLRGMGAAINDPYASELVTAAAGPLPDAAARILLRLDLELAADEQLVRAVAAAARELTASRRTSD